MIPAAMFELIFRYFGAGATPDYSATYHLLERDPYRPVRELISQRWDLSDDTDFQYDLSTVYSIAVPPDYVSVRLSLVGPYAVILGPDRELVDFPEMANLIERAGFQLVDRHVLASPVTIWSPEVEGTVYEFLFEFDNGYPGD